MNSALSDIEIIDIIDQFIDKSNINKKLGGICALTLAIDRSTLCGCFIFDYDRKVMLKHYPQRYDTNTPIYKTIGDYDFTINLATNLPYSPERGKHTGVPEDSSSFPFCCSNCIKSGKRLSNEYEFDNLQKSMGNSKYIFKVTKKISFGPLEFIKFFTLENGKVLEQDFTENENKINSFKIYTCKRHNTYYSVDLNTLSSTYTQHHAKGQNDTLYGNKILNAMK